MFDNAVERLFSLFTPVDRAEAAAGDLVEERERRGWLWFWLQVVRVTFALWRHAVIEAPVRVLALTLAGAVLLAAPAFAGLAAVYLFPRSAAPAINWMALSLFWCGGALWTGASLVCVAPRRGMPACAMLAAIGAAAVIALGATSDAQELWRPSHRMFFVIALIAVTALLAGAAMAMRRTVVIAVPFAVILAAAATVVFATAEPASSSPRQAEWRDPSPHKAMLVTVEQDVQLEVLDWGGSGHALVLLAGGGATAHQYDDMGPALATRYRVVSVTRRGHRGSSAATGGYHFARLAEDVVRVMDAVGLTTAVVVGSSFAGEEMHVLGARYPERIRGLVYVDAAFDRGDKADSETFDAVARTVPTAPGAEDIDKASYAALRAHLQRRGSVWPEGYVRTRYRANPDGTIAGLWAPERPVFQLMTKALQVEYNPYKPERIRVPALAIYSMPKSADDLMRRGSSDRSAFPELVAQAAADPDLRARVERLFELTRQRVRKHEKWFEAFAERGRVVELSGSHDLIVSNPREVIEQIDAFVVSLAGGR